MGKPYKDGVTADDIVFDGWSRGFCVEQTLDELQAMGFMAHRASVLQLWADYDAAMEADAMNHPPYDPIPHPDDVPGQHF